MNRKFYSTQIFSWFFPQFSIFFKKNILIRVLFSFFYRKLKSYLKIQSFRLKKKASDLCAVLLSSFGKYLNFRWLRFNLSRCILASTNQFFLFFLFHFFHFHFTKPLFPFNFFCVLFDWEETQKYHTSKKTPRNKF